MIIRKIGLVLGLFFLFTVYIIYNGSLAMWLVATWKETIYQVSTEIFLEDYLINAERGDAAAQFELGVAYEHGRSVPQNDEEAIRWYRLAADQGFVKAQNNLGIIYQLGKGTPVNYEEAARWYRLAADQGVARSQFNLGTMYYSGFGVPKNYITAYMWFNLAAAQGDAEASQNIRYIRQYMTPEQIAEAQRLSTEWPALHSTAGAVENDLPDLSSTPLFYDACAGKFGDKGEGFCLGYITILAQSLVLAEGICPPVGATKRQMQKIFIRWVDDHPKYLEHIAAFTVTLAFMDAYPCETKE